jgi:hypothetical protein
MDPDVAFAIAFDPLASNRDRHEHAVALLGWLYAGGFTPAACQSTRSELVDDLIVIRNGSRP